MPNDGPLLKQNKITELPPFKSNFTEINIYPKFLKNILKNNKYSKVF